MACNRCAAYAASTSAILLRKCNHYVHLQLLAGGHLDVKAMKPSSANKCHEAKIHPEASIIHRPTDVVARPWKRLLRARRSLGYDCT